ncbi:hypothetical protein E2542_SST13538 [Spatholobus suberectus]|nr:hypothetical protein E2542_SST13538 [Spatholobus suberectus]
MASLSVSDAATDTVADTTPNPKDNKNQSPTEPPLVVATKGVSDLRPVGEGWFLVKLEKKKKKKKKNRNRKRKAEEPPSKEAEEKGKGDPSAVPPIRRSARVRKRKRVQCSFPDVEGSHSVPQTGPSQSRGRGHVVGGGTHIPSHSSEPGIYNLLGAPVTAGATLVVQPSSSVSVQTPLPSHSSEPGISNVPAAPVTAWGCFTGTAFIFSLCANTIT